jgi:hypothetical protein
MHRHGKQHDPQAQVGMYTSRDAIRAQRETKAGALHAA